MKCIVLFTSICAFTLSGVVAEESPLAQPLRKFDANNDGKLTGDELVLARQAFNRGGKGLENGPKFFKEVSERRRKNWKEQQAKVLDLNGNGMLEEDENKRADMIWAEMSGEFDKVRAELLKKYDKNDDGELTQQEWEASRGEFDAKRKAIEDKVMAAHPKPASPGT